MNKQTEALKLALSVLDEVRSETFRLLRNGQKLYAEEKVWNAIFVIKQALAEQPAQKQEPVKIVSSNDMTDADWDRLFKSPASKPWVGLVWGELPEDGHNHDFLRGAAWAESKLREKNA